MMLGKSIMTPRLADKLATYGAALQALDNEDRLRRLKPRAGLDFSSNDYLALATAPRMRNTISAALQAGTLIGAGGSRRSHEASRIVPGQVARSGATLLVRKASSTVYVRVH